MDRRELVIAHSPDSDDAFMFYALATRKLRPRGMKLKHVLQDIESLNRQAREGVFEVTAISIAAYPYVAGRYRMLSTGASIGDGYGPLLVASHVFPVEELKKKKVAVPGTMTSAYLYLKLLEPEVETVVVPFDKILSYVKEGGADAGLIIHEGQLTFDRLGLHRILDLGRWWQQNERLPLPLGAVAVRRDLQPEACAEVNKAIRKSIEYAMEHREEALAYAMQFARDMDTPLADKFVGMYVNEYTLDLGARGREACQRFLYLGHERGLLPKVEIDFAPEHIATANTEGTEARGSRRP
jgi:1,4-dihydroxy-6-naphthoate synthase